MRRTLNIAHRGGAGLWPENTVFAFASAAKAGFDGAELDVQLTRDGQLVIFHDFRLNLELCRDSAGNWLPRKNALPAIRDLTFAELQRFDVGRPKPDSVYALKHPDLMPCDGEQMPSLAQVVAAVAPFRGFRLFVELKSDPDEASSSARPEALAEAVVGELRAKNFVERTILVGFDWRGLAHAKRIVPEIICWFTTKQHSRAGAEAVKAGGGEGWFCASDGATADAVAAARARGLAFGVWTINDVPDMRRLIGLGVDAICTDRPDRLQPLLD
jgi:glycerophosphoryl diester phosphodiesterase